jgi:hypothetical protein
MPAWRERGAYHLWCRLGIDTAMARLLEGYKLNLRVERVLFALVTDWVLDPASKLAAARWVTRKRAAECAWIQRGLTSGSPGIGQSQSSPGSCPAPVTGSGT